MTTKTRKRYNPTQAYLDPTAALLTVVAPNSKVLAHSPVPQNVTEADRADQEAWTRDTLRTMGFRTKGKFRDYPYGILVNV